MKLAKFLFFLVSTIMITSACRMGDLSPALPAHVPTNTSTVAPSISPRSTQAPIRTPIFLFPTPLSTPRTLPFPAWISDFSDPILKTLDRQRPDFQDGFTGVNKGWFYFIPDSRRGPFYAHMQNGTLLIKLPAENEDKDFWVYNPKLIQNNFVLSLDFQFEETQPGDTVRFKFSQTADQSVALDLSKNQIWTLHWGSHANWQSITGTFDYFAPERITVLIIMQGERCAVYLNDNPLIYLNNCRTGSIVQSSP